MRADASTPSLSSAPRPMASYVMRRAWQLRCWNPKMIFADCLRLAWADARSGRFEHWDFLPDEIRFPNPVARLGHQIRELWGQRMQIEMQRRLSIEDALRKADLLSREMELRRQRAALDPRYDLIAD